VIPAQVSEGTLEEISLRTPDTSGSENRIDPHAAVKGILMKRWRKATCDRRRLLPPRLPSTSHASQKLKRPPQLTSVCSRRRRRTSGKGAVLHKNTPGFFMWDGIDVEAPLERNSSTCATVTSPA